MSYSRWSNSIWYTFWSATPKQCIPMEGFNPEDEQFSVDCEMDFSYKSLKKDIEDCINKVRSHYEFKLGEDNENLPSDADYDELRGYMQEFIKDVEEEYPELLSSK